jgi:hypothetical protein
MALTKETVVDKIEVLESNAIQVRSAIRVLGRWRSVVFFLSPPCAAAW